ncbi:MAG: biotin/lipoyl-binding protein [Lachnospiraceae bacterium]|nr:biotin/lipoyl-binding protein [Lachnospiraceae bacterium]MCD8053938.1 biotin/lipoyl-binding protein [Lachnospiraceae bacterium]
MEIKSRVPGVIEEVLVEEGDQVEEKTVVAKLEAMKMVQKVLTPVSGEVTEVCVEKGARVKPGQVLMVIE